MNSGFFGSFLLIVLIIYLAIVVYVLVLATRLVKVVERIAEKLSSSSG